MKKFITEFPISRESFRSFFDWFTAIIGFQLSSDHNQVTPRARPQKDKKYGRRAKGKPNEQFLVLRADHDQVSYAGGSGSSGKS